MNALVAAGAAGLATLLLTPLVGRGGFCAPGVDETPQGISPADRTGWTAWLPLLVGTAAWLCGSGLLVAAVVGGLARAVMRGRSRRHVAAALATADSVAVEACGVLVDEVRAGRHPVEALATASRVDPALRLAHAAALAGTDVPAALRASGASSHRAVAAAWQVAERHGAGLAPALARVVEQVRADASTARVVASELASARATSRLLVALPGFALVAATISGGRPWEFLVGSGGGRFCLVLGLSLGWAGLRWIDAIGDAVARPPQ